MSEPQVEAGAGAAPSQPGGARGARGAQGVGGRPPAEVVLPLPYYLILALEVAALVGLRLTRPEESGGERYSYLIGWAGTLSMCLMHVYSLRRRVRALRGWGPIRAWLQFHIFCGLQGAILVGYHALNLRTIGNLAGINIALVAIVVLSGIFGRYLFAFIPKGAAGERLTAKQIDDEIQGLSSRVEAGAPTPELAAAVAEFAGGQRLSAKLSLGAMIGEDLRARRALRALDAALRASLRKRMVVDAEGVEKLEAFVAAARRRVLLARRLTTFTAAERLFRYWTIFHKPLTFLLLGSTLLHVLAHYLFTAAYSA